MWGIREKWWREQVGGMGTIEVERLVAEVRAPGMGH